MTAPPLPASPPPPPSLRQLQPLVPALPLTEGQGATPAGRRPVDLVLAIAHAPLLRDIAAVLLLAVASLVLFWDGVAHGRVAFENDTRIFYYPLFARLGEAVRAGQLPLWSSQLFGGYPMYADGEAGTFYPIHLLTLLLLPTETAFIWLRPLRFFQAALFTYLFGRCLGLGRFGSVVGALAFAFSGFSIAQLHHTNINTAAVWLPLALAFGELALRHRGRARYAFAILAGVAFGMQGLVIHVQIVLMSGLAFALFCAFRALTGPAVDPQPHGRLTTMARQLGLAAGIVAIAGGAGAALSAVQLLPLYELGTFSFRGEGVDYAFASQYSLPPGQLLTFLLPDFFVVNGQYWGLWSRWEVFAYVGLAPLILALLGIVLARQRLVIFFLGLGAFALVVSLGEHSPLGIHRMLSGLPGFSVLRAPGRFLFLLTLSVAMLAALGADALRRELSPAAGGEDDAAPGRRGASPQTSPGSRVPSPESAVNSGLRAQRGGAGAFAGGALGAGTPGEIVRRAALSLVLLLCQLAAMAAPLALALAAVFVETHKPETIEWLQATVTRMRGFDARWTVEHLYRFVLTAVDVTQPSTLRQLALLGGTVAVLSLWDRLRVMGRVWQVLLVLLLTVDLIGFGKRFHPTMPFQTLATPSGLTAFLEQNPGLYRVFTQKGSRDEPNRLLSFSVAEANGYSSLEPDRHQQFVSKLEYAPNRLLDLFNVRYYAVKNEFVAAQSFNLTAYDPRRPLLSSTGRNPAGSGAFRLDDVPADSIRVVSTLRWANNVPQGVPVARLTATDNAGREYTFHLQAGVHTAEWAWERPDLKGKIPHQLPRVARTWQQQDGRAQPYPAHYYYAEFPLGGSVKLRRLELQFLHQTAQVEIFGLALYNDATKDLDQVDTGRLEKYKRVYVDDEIIVYENRDYLPRAYLVPSAVIERPGEDVLNRLTLGDFSPERMVILEEQFDLSTLAPVAPPGQGTPIRANQPAGTEVTSGPGTVHILRFDEDLVRLEARARQNAMLVLADMAYPGWKAYVDGREAKIYRANHLFRAVFIPSGQHTVEFVYRPRSLRLGLLITMLATAGTVVALAWLTLDRALLAELARRASQTRVAKLGIVAQLARRTGGFTAAGRPPSDRGASPGGWQAPKDGVTMKSPEAAPPAAIEASAGGDQPAPVESDN